MCPGSPPRDELLPITADSDESDFKAFEHFPLEVQRMIFQHAFPGPQVIELAFYVWEDYDFFHESIIRTLTIDRPMNVSMLPFLQACVTSRDEFHRQFRKIEFSMLGMYNPAGYSRPRWTVPRGYRHYRIENRFRFYRGNRFYIYIRPDKDILTINAFSLLKLYDYGGDISMINITHLALSDIEIHEWDPVREYLYSDRIRTCRNRLFSIISTICPALLKINLLLDTSGCLPFPPPPDSVAQILDVDSEFPLQPFADSHGKKFSRKNKEYLRKRLYTVYEYEAKERRRDWKKFLKFLGKKSVPSSDVLDFWRTREPVPAMYCWFLADLSNEHGPVHHPRPQLYIPSLKAWLPAHADGTVVDKYKGLAQIFDGAPW